MKNIFQTVALGAPRKNKFDLSHEKKMTIAMGDLIPTMFQECFPGEVHSFGQEIFMRFNPLLYPVMHQMNIYTNTFFIPWRLLWEEFPDFITGGEDGLAEPVFPKLVINQDNAQNISAPGTLGDYLGIPQMDTGGTWQLKVSALPFIAYQLLWNEYYRDQNIQPKLVLSKASGDRDSTQFSILTAMRKRAWEKDYFTSALPWAQRGAPVVTPLNGAGTVTYKETSEVKDAVTGLDADGTLSATGSGLNASVSGQARIENIDEVALTSAGITINDLRVATRLQEWLERAARGGSRLIEMIQSMFGQKSSDARLQRPEYIDGTVRPIRISEVLQTSETLTTPLGTQGGHAMAMADAGRKSYKCEEHGFLMTLMTVMPRTAYQQGLDKSWQKFDKFDLLWPTFANLGEQPVYSKELYIDPADPAGFPTEVFGYQSRYAEYKYKSSTVHGLLKDTQAYQHMGRIFASRPTLSSEFITSDPTYRIFPTELTNQQITCQVLNHQSALRPLPYHNIPTL